MKWPDLVRLARELPEVDEGIWFRTPCVSVRGKSFTRLKDDGLTVVFVTEDVDEQEALIAAKPIVYFITGHYRGFPAVLARLSNLSAAECRARLAVAWRRKAPKKLLREFDAATRGAPHA